MDEYFTHLFVIVFLAIFIFSCLSISAQPDYDRYLRAYQLNEVGAPVVTSIFRDSKGFMWFGSPNGLFRWDGFNAHVYRHVPNDTNSLSEDPIRSVLFEDKSGCIWLSTLTQGLHKYDRATEKFHPLNLYNKSLGRLPYDQILQACQDTMGNVWGITVGHRFFKYDPENKIANIFLADTAELHNPINTVLSALLDHTQDFFWLGTAKGLLQFDIVTKQYSRFVTPPFSDADFEQAAFNSIIQDSNDIYWFGTSSGLYRFDRINNLLQSYKHSEYTNSIGYDHILGLANNIFDNGSSIWIFSGDGLDRLIKSDNKFLHYYLDENKQKFIFSPFISVDHYEYFDNNGFLWLATDNLGPVMINLKEIPFSQHRIKVKSTGNTQYDATSFLQDKYGDLWIGTGFGGLLHFDRQYNLVHAYEHNPDDSNSLSNNFIHDILEDSSGEIWVATDNGLNKLDRLKHQFYHFLTIPVPGGLPNVSITDIFQDKANRLWIGTSQGAYYTDQPDVEKVLFHNCSEIPSLYLTVQQIFQDSQENIWFLTPIAFGLYCLKHENGANERMINYNINDKDSESFFTDGAICIHEDPDGVIWLGTTKGLYKWKPDRNSVEHFHSGNGLGANLVCWIEEDGQGNLWLSTEYGLIRFNPSARKEEMVKKYTLRDGLPFENMYTWKFYKDSDGKFFIGGRMGTGEGFYFFHPDSLLDNKTIPPVVITDFKVRNEAFKLDSNISEKKYIRLKSYQNYFSFEFAALDFNDPEMNHYAYMLNGFDDGWIYCNERRFANYTGVSPGSYLFRVRGCNSDGYWNDDGASVWVTILPPPWKTWWAYILYCILIVSVLYSIGWYYVQRQKLRHQLELEHFQKEKLAELDTMKSSFFTNISHEFRSPLTLILGLTESILTRKHRQGEIKDLSIIRRNALRLKKLIDQLLNLSKLEAGRMKLQLSQVNVSNFVASYVQLFESLAKLRRIELLIILEKKDINAWIDIEKFENILYNLLSNAFKFTPEHGTITVKVTSGNHQKSGVNSVENLVLIVSDTGIGIPMDKIDKIFDRFYQVENQGSYDVEGTGIGLSLVKELAELHHGKIYAESISGKGSAFTLIIPIIKEVPGSIRFSKDDLFIGDLARKNEEELKREITSLFMMEGQVDMAIYPASSDTSKKGKPFILIIDDNAEMCYFMNSLLVGDYQIIEARNGNLGMAMAFEQIPDLIISDIMMPGIDGYELCRKLKSDERTSHIPVILLTAKAAMEDKLEGLETGADEFITKPFQPVELMVRVKNLIRQRQLLREKYRKEFEHISLRPENGMTSIDARFMEKARKVVSENLSNPEFDISDFSSRMNMSRVQLHRKLSGLFNLSATEFIRTYRLNAAARLFESKMGNVAQVAYEVGFNNLSYFSKCFQKQFGVKPSEYMGNRA